MNETIIPECGLKSNTRFGIKMLMLIDIYGSKSTMAGSCESSAKMKNLFETEKKKKKKIKQE